MLTEKVGQIAINNNPTNDTTIKTQVVARRNCPAWTAGTSVDIFTRWVKDWNTNDKSDDLVKYMDLTKSLSENKSIPGLKEYMKNIVTPSLSVTGEEKVASILEKLSEKYKKNKYEEFTTLIDMIEEFSIGSNDNAQLVWERFLQIMERTKLVKLSVNLDYFFLTLFLKKCQKAKLLSSYEENTLRGTLGGEDEAQPADVLKSFGGDYLKLKVQNNRNFSFESESQAEMVHKTDQDPEESVHFGERGRAIHRGSKFIRSSSNPRLFRQARSQSWNNARSQSRSRPNQKFHNMVGSSYWYNKDDFKRSTERGYNKLDQILKYVQKNADNFETLSQKVDTIENKLNSVNYCEEDVREIHFTEDDRVDNQIIIDSGCPKSLSGEDLIKSYCKKHNLVFDKLKRKSCATIFKFGSSRYPSYEIVELPVKLPLKSNIDQASNCFVATIDTNVVKGNVPFLLGDNTMKNWLSKIDVAERTLELHKYKDSKGNPILINAPLRGSHMKIEMMNLREKSLNESVHYLEQQVLAGGVLTDFKSVRKVHERLNHKSKDNLAHAYSNADMLTKELKETIQKVVDQCKVCQKYWKSMPRPVVTLPKCNDFNQIVTLDLKSWGSKYILWMICSFTRFIKGAVLPNKEAETVISAVVLNWNCNFGLPSTGFWCDNGTEFKNSEMSEFCSKNGLVIKFGPAYSPWANGINERNHASADKIVAKIIEGDKKVTLNEAVCLAGWCHNTNINRLGYSPMQLVTGKSVIFPGLSTGTISSDSPFDSEYVRQIMIRHIELMKEFQVAEYSEKLNNVLKKGGKSWQNIRYEQGDLVYVQLQDKKSWSGPVKVFAHDGGDVWVFHNGNLIKLATCRVAPMVEPYDEEKEVEDEVEDNGNVEEVQKSKNVRYNLRSNSSKNESDVETGKNKKKFAEKENFYILAENHECFNEEFVYVVEVPTKEHNRSDVIQAKQKEIDNLKCFETFSEVENIGQTTIDSRWVITQKEDHDGQKTKIKARIVAKGFQEVDKPQSDSPTVSRESLKTFTAIAANQHFKICSIDITGAFLQADKLDRDIFVRPPPDIRKQQPNILWLLKKPLYGLDDSSRKFYLRVKKLFVKNGLEILPSDNAYFYCLKNGSLVGQVVIHVDDFFISGNEEFVDWFIKMVSASLKVSKVEFGCFRFTGVDIREDGHKIIVSMNAYADSLIPIADFRKENNTVLLNDLELQVYRKYTGKLMWLSDNCRPDLAFLANQLSRRSHNATISDLKYINKVLKKVRERDSEVVYSYVGEKNDLAVQVMSDASYKKIKDSVSGTLIILSNVKDFNAVPLYWKSRKISKMTTSTKDAETHALFKGLGDAAYIASNIETLLYGSCKTRIKINSYIDSKPLLESIASTKIIENKFLVTEINAMKKLLEDQLVKSYIWVDTSDQMADVLTKDMVEPTNFRSLFLRNRCDLWKFQANPKAVLKIHAEGTDEENTEIRME